MCNYYGVSMYSDNRLVHLFCQLAGLLMSIPDFGSFTMCVDDSVEVSGGDNCGFLEIQFSNINC